MDIALQKRDSLGISAMTCQVRSYRLHRQSVSELHERPLAEYFADVTFPNVVRSCVIPSQDEFPFVI
jgi:hypothetical protein